MRIVNDQWTWCLENYNSHHCPLLVFMKNLSHVVLPIILKGKSYFPVVLDIKKWRQRPVRSHGLAGGKTGFCFHSDLLGSLGQLFYFPGFLFSLRETGWGGFLSLDTLSKVCWVRFLGNCAVTFPLIFWSLYSNDMYIVESCVGAGSCP